MKLSENTISVLKNFATINPTLLVRPGNVISTIMPSSRSMFGKAIVEETFPKQFAIYELSKFLGVISLFKDPEIEFEDNYLVLNSGRNKTIYTYASPDAIIAPPEKELVLPTNDIEFDITAEELQRIVRAAGILQVSNISVTSEDGRIVVSAVDSKIESTNKYSLDVGATERTFNMIFDISYITKLMSNDYNVKISSRGFSQFNTTGMTYFIANEAKSHFGE